MLKTFAAFILFLGVVDFVYQFGGSTKPGLNHDWLICLLVASVTTVIDLRLLKLESINKQFRDAENQIG